LEELDYEGEELLAGWQRDGHIHPFVPFYLAPMNRRLLRQAEVVVVHSGWSWRRVRQTVDAPVVRVPMAVPRANPPADVAAELAPLAEAQGVAERGRLVGKVPMADLTAYAAASDVCVQLRYPTHGETSAALLRAMAAGAACVVSDEGWMAELPDRAVRKVRS